MRSSVLFVALLVVGGAYCDDCKDVKCPSLPKHYEEFGCEAITKTGDCCPTQFDCSALKNRNGSLCYYNNETIEIGEPFHSRDIEASCTIGCSCRASRGDDFASLECTHIDCPEFLGGLKTEPGKKCISQYAEHGCCIANTVCGEEISKLEKCEFEGKSYYEGQRIDTDRSCYSCVCGKGWENKPVESNKHCHKINCNMEVHYYKRMLSDCIPVYYQTDDCCPITWRCPDETTTVVRANTLRSKAENVTSDVTTESSLKREGETNSTTIVSPDATAKVADDKGNSTEGALDTTTKVPESSAACTFGSLKMDLGDFLSPENDYDQCTICTCKVPPYPHCIKTC